ncbi:hypothetical protein E2C01_016227 [Portunus trituberculatus]|uniref:Uncharacterized protein n=1 Tax=Portunus trituberculatus TaxID=210409 RepID=A0A5B7DQ23_PORTR|nr:hypothetical protein [Portunus trituberculatus]
MLRIFRVVFTSPAASALKVKSAYRRKSSSGAARQAAFSTLVTRRYFTCPARQDLICTPLRRKFVPGITAQMYDADLLLDVQVSVFTRLLLLLYRRSWRHTAPTPAPRLPRLARVSA